MSMRDRPRRLRRTPALREALAGARVHAAQLVQAHFVMDGEGEAPVRAMPGIARQGIRRLVEQVGADRELGLRSVLLFGVTDRKDDRASAATAGDGLVPRAVAALRESFGDDVVVMTDVCLCGYTDHGHCGVLKDGEVLNDESLPLLAAMAVSHARAGADVVAPSDMMDGRVAAIRAALDETGHERTARPRTARRRRATGARTSSTRATRARRSRRACWTRPRAPTCSW
jgi:porphobilinogen synthase